MADAKNTEIELDLDDVKETDVKVEETKEEESKEPNLNVGEVDLGYTDHDKEQKEENVQVEEVEEQPAEDKTFENERETKLDKREDPDDLTQVSESVKKKELINLQENLEKLKEEKRLL